MNALLDPFRSPDHLGLKVLAATLVLIAWVIFLRRAVPKGPKVFGSEPYAWMSSLPIHVVALPLLAGFGLWSAHASIAGDDGAVTGLTADQADFSGIGWLGRWGRGAAFAAWHDGGWVGGVGGSGRPAEQLWTVLFVANMLKDVTLPMDPVFWLHHVAAIGMAVACLGVVGGSDEAALLLPPGTFILGATVRLTLRQRSWVALY